MDARARRVAGRPRTSGVRAAAGESSRHAGVRPDGLGALVRTPAATLPRALRDARAAPLRAGRDRGRRSLRGRRRGPHARGARGSCRAAESARDRRLRTADRPSPGRGDRGPLAGARPHGAARHTAVPARRPPAGHQLARHGALGRAVHQRVRAGRAGRRALAARCRCAAEHLAGRRARAHGAAVRGDRLAGGGLCGPRLRRGAGFERQADPRLAGGRRRTGRRRA